MFFPQCFRYFQACLQYLIMATESEIKFSIAVDSKKKRLKDGALPTQNMPKKRFEKGRKERRQLNIVNDQTAEPSQLFCCKKLNKTFLNCHFFGMKNI